MHVFVEYSAYSYNFRKMLTSRLQLVQIAGLEMSPSKNLIMPGPLKNVNFKLYYFVIEFLIKSCTLFRACQKEIYF